MGLLRVGLPPGEISGREFQSRQKEEIGHEGSLRARCSPGGRNALLAIGAGGLIAGSFALTSAFITFGFGVRARLQAVCWAGRRWYLSFGCDPALLDCIFIGGDLLLSQSSPLVFAGTPAGVRAILQHWPLPGHESHRVAALRAAWDAAHCATGLDSRPPGAHVSDRAAHLLQRSAVRPTGPARAGL
jgi:hypothetical protein